MPRFFRVFFLVLLLVFQLVCSNEQVHADEVVLTSRMHHLRQMEPREWSTFPEHAESDRLELKFETTATGNHCLSLRQQDVKARWTIHLNGQSLGELHVDENDMRVYYDVDGQLLKRGENLLTIECRGGRSSDDIRVGEISLLDRSRSEVLSEATLQVSVCRTFEPSDLLRQIEAPDVLFPGNLSLEAEKVEFAQLTRRLSSRFPDSEATSGGSFLESDENRPVLRTPARITIVNADGSLQECLAESDRDVAVRPGTVYVSNRAVRISLPAGSYQVFAGRGFEYSLADSEVSLTDGEEKQLRLTIKREVDTTGWVACDTHVHTRTHSGHGDSTVQERMVTLAGEGIELPIATDHNVHIDHRPFAREADLEQYFTPVVGNEVTTKVGHFNVFPVTPGAELPNHKLTDWDAIADSINQVDGVKVVILNHARDIHSNVRPFGPSLFNDAVGEHLNGWRFRANAMETVNSSANQTDILQLFRDWMTMLNRGYQVTPVGCSDSHDVLRHFVGQGRTYIRCDDRDPGNIDVDQAVNSFVQGRVMVSYGLLASIRVNDRYGSGELVRIGGDSVRIKVRVQGPHWTRATRVQLFANGTVIREAAIPEGDDPARDRKLDRVLEWTIPRPKHDVFLTAIATGPGITSPYWRTAWPYQPVSPEFTPKFISCSGAVWLDADGDGHRTSARGYAERIMLTSSDDISPVLEALESHDEATSSQAAFLIHRRSGLSGRPPFLSGDAQASVRQASQHVQQGFQRYVDAWRRCQIAAVK